MEKKSEQQPKREAPAGFRVTRWNGMRNYECTRCPFATLDEERAREHSKKHGGGEQQ